MNIPINKLKKKKFIEITKKLTVFPNAGMPNQYQYGPPTKFVVYRASREENMLTLPRFYKNPILDEVMEHVESTMNGDPYRFSDSIPHHIHSELREHQKTAIQHIEKGCNGQGGGMLCLGCGLGKTVVAIEMIARRRVRTLVIVHKEFLMNQWKERIEMFLPEARIGYLYQNKMEIEDKDIVLAMLQSLSMKDYESNAFDSIGQLIVDECHHIAAQVFSKAMYKINAPYVLGLTATPERKDGLIYVLKWFMGDIVFSMESTKENAVHVIKMNTPHSIDITYNKMDKISMPTMITDLSKHERRNADIVECILKLLENVNRHILVLSDRRDQLKHLGTLLGSELSGLYIGAMKQSNLDETTTKRVMLSTYSMTAEAFDQPKLNTLIFATPKTDIEQSVGRILRKKHTEVIPLVVDFVDPEVGVFKVQYYQRHRLYKSFNYTVHHMQTADVECMEDSLKTKDAKTLTYYTTEPETPAIEKAVCLFDSDSD